MTISFLLLAAITIIGTAAAMTLKNLGALCPGPVARTGRISSVVPATRRPVRWVHADPGLRWRCRDPGGFAIMMTRALSRPSRTQSPRFRLRRVDRCPGLRGAGLGNQSPEPRRRRSYRPTRRFRQPVGDALMHRFVLPLEVIGLLLTAALIGAGILAMDEHRGHRRG